MKVIFFKSNYHKAGGIETLLKSVFGRIDTTRFELKTIVMTHVPDEPLSFIGPDFLEQNPDHLELIPWNGFKSLPEAVKITRGVIDQFKPDVLYTHDMRSNLLVFCVSFFNKTPWVAHIHGWLGKSAGLRTWFFEWVDRKLIRKAKTVLVGSNALRHRIKTECGVDDVRLIPNAIDTGYFNKSSDWDRNIRKTLFPGFDGVIIGSVGRLHLVKGGHILVETFAKLHKENPDIRCIIMGEGPEEENLKQQARDLGIEAYILFPGFVEDMRPYIYALDVFMLCSLAESLPLALLEGICMGKPAVGSDVGDVGCVLDFGKEDLIVSAGDVEGFYQALKKLVNKPDLRKRYGQLSREKVEAEYSIDSAVNRIQEILSEFAD